MLYDLPHHRPPITLVGPHDTVFWTALGVEPAGRHALVLGEASAPAAATVIAGTPLDLARYVDPFTGTLPTTIGALAARVRAELSADEAQAPRPATPTPRPAVPVEPGVELITLPHSGIRVPHDRFRMSRYRELPTADGVAFTATLKLDKTIVGLIQNEGTGGPTHFQPTDFPYRQLVDYVQACRTATGQPCSEEYVLDELVTEFVTARRIAKCARAGRCALRLMAPLGTGPDFEGEYYTVGEADAAAVTSDAQRTALAGHVQQQMPPGDGQWWQIWTGQRWEDLTPRPATSSRPDGAGQ